MKLNKFLCGLLAVVLVLGAAFTFAMPASAAENVAKIGEQGYESLSAAIAAAKAGDTITFVADITEDVTISKAVTIDAPTRPTPAR